MNMSNTLVELKRAIQKSGMSRYALSQQTGVPESVLSRWWNGTRSLSIETIETLADALDLKVMLIPKTKQIKSQKNGA